jgi:hypothetical protein
MKFSLERFRPPESHGNEPAVVKKVRTPGSDEAAKVNKEKSCDVLLLKTTSGYSLVSETLYEQLKHDLVHYKLVLARNDKGEFFLWPVRVDEPTAVEAMKKAEAGWTRTQWSIAADGYISEPVTHAQPPEEPAWPDADIAELVEGALGGKVIDDPEHKVAKRLIEKRRRGGSR